MNELMKALTDFLKEATVYLGRQNGKAAATLAPTYPSATPEAQAAIVEKRAKRTPKAEKVVAAAEPSPFAPVEPEQPAGKPAATKATASIEDQAEAKRRCQEVMGLFIRRYLKATPTGLDRAKTILAEVCGRAIAKLEDLTHEDNIKLIPRFESELEKA